MSGIELYFDYLSPYAYFGWHRARELASARGIELVLRPVLFAGLLSRWGHKGPAEIPPKRAFIIKDCLRYASRHDIPFTFPRPHPFRPLTALRVSFESVEQATIVPALWEAAWVQGKNLGDDAVVAAALDGAGLDGDAIVARSRDAAVKAKLRSETDAATERGVFGVPTFAVGDELIWGNDRLDDVVDCLDGRDPADPAVAQALIDAPYGVRR